MKENCGLFCVMCRKQDILNFENIHVKPHRLLKAMVTSKSAVLLTAVLLIISTIWDMYEYAQHFELK